ncbi:ABC transporter substrate-binding protein [Actinoplanes teichomyceticus]|uniref:Sulfonate transport system substrate-binding protein n=1 Tax=Actinoplanes teichomyceticus TaxID=1867 RepID=A0A561WAH4_ACTTI|nr:ABC transporter substrate-binding protein [Actinoplanes teichomyceticus]TWG20857.1 sulfonate transport system substrate-binding protein [Actinoplanes teichomyceticus]GIF14518.1 ABC transporter substrate-binding protein [Actinoplanes teichomyceticus]
MTGPTLNRRTLLGGLLGVTALGLAGCGGDDAAAANLTASDPLPTTVDPATELVISIHTTQVALQAAGEIDKLPFKVKDWPNISAGPDVIQGFRARSIDLAANAGIPPIQAAAINVDARIVAVQTKKEPQYTYVTAPGNPVAGITDLRGKKIGFSQGQAQGLVVLRTLKEQGLTPKDVELVALPSTKFLVALQSKQIDVAPLYEPSITKYLSEYGKDGATQFPMTAVDYLTILWAPGEVLADSAKVAAIRAFIPIWARSTVWRWENQKKWLDAYYVKDQGVSAADAQRIGATEHKPHFPRRWDKAVAWQKESADLLVEGGFIKPIDAEKLFDRRFETIAADAVPAEYQE